MLWLALAFIVALYVLLAILALLLIPARVAKPSWHLPRPGKTLTEYKLPPSWQGATDPKQLNLSFEHVSFPTYANLTLRGWLIPSHNPASQVSPSSCPSSRIAIACVHGAGRDRRAFLRHSAFLTNAGYDVLLFDCSNHGVSDSLPMWPMATWPGRAVSLGKREHLDVKAAVDFLVKRGASSVVVMGTSQGASSAIIAAAQCRSIKLLLLENPFVSPDMLVRHIVDTVLSKLPVPFFRSLIAPPVTWLSLLRTGNIPCSAQLRAIDFVRHVNVPMFFIHGTADLLVHHSQSEMLHNTVRHSQKDLWLVEDAAHTQCYYKEPRQFQERVLGFLRAHLTHEDT